jgi:hypothetical protein
MQPRCVVRDQPLSVDQRVAFFEGALDRVEDLAALLIEQGFDISLSDQVLVARQLGFDLFNGS